MLPKILTVGTQRHLERHTKSTLFVSDLATHIELTVHSTMDTTTTSESQAAASPLPVELLAIILKQVQSRKDHISFSAASKLLRDIALPGLFETVYVYSNDRWDRKLGQLENADEKIRTLIRHILVDQFVPRNAHTPASYAYLSAFPRLESVIFPGNLARTLYKNHTASFAFADLAPLLAALRPAPLRTLILDVIRDTTYAKGFTAYVPASAPPVAGLQGLEKLRLGWRVHDAKGAPPGNAYARLAALVRPSLTTLVHLELDIDQDRRRPAPFDLTQLRDAAPTLRTLRYQTQYDDTNVLDTITTLFPLLERLCLKWDAYWKSAHLTALARLRHLEYLATEHDFEHAARDTRRRDHDFRWYARCLQRRVDATRALAAACPVLERCVWTQLAIDTEGNSMQHPVVVRAKEDGGREVLPEAQDWMDEWTCDRYNGGEPLWDGPTVVPEGMFVHGRLIWQPPMEWA